MMFIYCRKPEVREALLKAGFKLITAQEQKGEQTVWIFEYNSKLQMPNFEDKNAVLLSKKMSF